MVQDFLVLTGQAMRNIVRGPHYNDDVFLQMDDIGVGSLVTVCFIGFFAGVVMSMQMSRALSTYGQNQQDRNPGFDYSCTRTRACAHGANDGGPQRYGHGERTGIDESNEQIDAMRALGTDPIQKLVTPRLEATSNMMPLLTVISDFVGMFGGWIIAVALLNLSSRLYWTKIWRALEWNDVAQGLLKPLIFGITISLMGCFYGLRASGGTQGVGRATTQAMVASAVMILLLDTLVTKIFVATGPT